MKSGSNLERVLASGEFAVTGELGPPKSSDSEVVRKKARILQGNVDAVNITDCQTAIVRMSSIGAGLIAQSEGVEPVIQMTCRDRNRIGMQSDLLAASSMGLKNLLCLTGDHQKFGNHPGSKGVFDMDSIQMLGMVREMRDEKKFQCGEPIKGEAPKFFLGAAANPFANPFEFRAVRLGKKIVSGADFVQTQIIYNVDKFAKFMEMCRDMGLDEKASILAGVTPPKSLGMARYMKKFVPGMDVTDEVLDRMKGASDKQEEGINICVDIINQVKEIKGVAGVHIMAIEWEEAVAEICERAGLLPRPTFKETVEPVMVAADERETISVREEGVDKSTNARAVSDVLAQARKEAKRIVAEAKAEAESLRIQAAPGAVEEYAGSSVAGIESDAGEHAMNEKERLMALESMKQGLDALKKAYGLSDDQFDALMKFAGAEAILKKEPPTDTAASVATPVSSAVPKAETVTAKVGAETDAAARKKTEAKAKAEAEAKAKAAAEAKTKAEADVKAQSEAKAKAEAEARSAARLKAEIEAKAKAEDEAKTKAAAAAKVEQVAAAPKAKSAPKGLSAPELKSEATPFSERAAKVPPSAYKQDYSGIIREVVLGNGDNAVTVGGSEVLPYHLFEGGMPHKPLIAMEVQDIKPDNWPATLTRYFDDVMDNPVAWAQKCVNEYDAEALNIYLIGTDPNGENRSPADAAKDAAAIIDAVDVPIIVWGCGNNEKDTDTLREVTAIIGDKKVCLAPLEDANYRAVGATAMAFHHPMVAASPIDVNLAKQLNILLENLGVPLDTVLMDPSIGALGYGIEYTYSVMERIRIAALTQKDEKLQVPIICNLGREVWKAKEVGLPSDDVLGDQERRGIMMEAMTASCMMLAGGEVLIMRHPKAINMTKSLINGLMA